MLGRFVSGTSTTSVLACPACPGLLGLSGLLGVVRCLVPRLFASSVRSSHHLLPLSNLFQLHFTSGALLHFLFLFCLQASSIFGASLFYFCLCYRQHDWSHCRSVLCCWPPVGWLARRPTHRLHVVCSSPSACHRSCLVLSLRVSNTASFVSHSKNPKTGLFMCPSSLGIARPLIQPTAVHCLHTFGTGTLFKLAPIETLRFQPLLCISLRSICHFLHLCHQSCDGDSPPTTCQHLLRHIAHH